MSTVKITELPLISTISANTSNTLFLGVDVPTLTTGKMTVTTLAAGLYSNNTLIVGKNQNLLPNTVAQFSLAGDSYVQTNLLNTNDGGSADIVVTANTGTDSTYFIDMGYVNKNYQPGLEYNNIGTAVYPLDGYLYAQGSAGLPGGNLVVGTTTANTSLKFIVGGGTGSNVVATMTSNSLVLNTQSYITFADGSKQTTAASSNAYTQASFDKANAANILAQSAYTFANTVNAFSYSAYAQANSAFNKANNALANTTGTFAGDLTITGNTSTQALNTSNLIVNGTVNVSGVVSMNSQVVITNTTFSATQAALTISATPNVAAPTQAGTLLHLSSKANTPGRLIIDSFGVNQNTAYSIIAGRSARGTVDAPTASQSGDILMRFAGNGYGTTGYAPLGVGRIDIVASENYTDTARGSQIIFYNNLVGTNTPIQIATFNGASAQFQGYVNPQRGFVYTPLVYPAAQTAITIDIANNSLVRAQTATGLTVTLSNLLAGKEVVAWITNTAGGNQTFTHGLPALNSTVNATTYTIPGTSTILVRYMCIDGTSQNTFVAITHA